MELRHRERSEQINAPSELGRSYIWYNNAIYPNSLHIYQHPAPYFCPVTYDSETCEDELHAGPPWRTGGPLDIRKFWTNEYEFTNSINAAYGLYRYDGGFVPASGGWAPVQYLDWKRPEQMDDGWGAISSYGATGWNRYRPAQPSVNLGQALAELRELPMMLKQTSKGFSDLWKSMGGSFSGFGPKSVASHWLNTQFGWIPFLNDLRDLYETTRSLDQQLQQLRRDNGNWIRRGGTVYEDSDTEVLAEEADSVKAAGCLWPVLVTPLYRDGYGKVTVRRKTETKVWFVGAFRYYISGQPQSWMWNAKAVASLYGLQPSPSLIYNLTPWSWLIDWWSNTGDVIENMSAAMFDHLVAKYAYVMGTKKQTVTTECEIRLRPDVTVTKIAEASIERKLREAANPFGFGLQITDLSDWQLSILASLGITRLH